MIKKPRVVVGMSGGVDSSVVAAILKNQGYDVVGVFMQFWFPSPRQSNDPEFVATEGSSINSGAVPASATSSAQGYGGSKSGYGVAKYGENRCCSLESFNEARQVADILGITLHKLNFGQPFKDLIVDSFLKDYKAGKTPNPCVACNKFIKFDLFLNQAKVVFGADYIATGHYAKNTKTLKHKNIKIGFEHVLARGKDAQKDQSYFLYNLKQSQLKHILFPLGDMEKTEVRKLAKKYKLPVHNKKDSQEVCFVGDSHQAFLKQYLHLKAGKIVTRDFILTSPQPSPLDKERGNTRTIPLLSKERLGEVLELGRHEGLPLYTIGQRTGIGLSGGPWYVCGFDYKKNLLIVTRDEKKSGVYQTELTFHKANWIGGQPKFPLKCEAQVRYHGRPGQCVVTPAFASDYGAARKVGSSYRVKFKVAQRAIMPGQSVVFYLGEEMLGGGVIG